MRRIAILLIILLCFIHVKSQDVAFSQFYSSPLYLNPAYAGVREGPRFTAVYRNQWPLLGKAYSTYFASYDQYFNAIHSGIGAMVMSDVQSGFYFTNSITGLYSYQVRLSEKWTINGAIEAAFTQKIIQTDKLIFAENINPGNGSVNNIVSTDVPDNPSRSFADFGAGVLFYSQKIFAGFSARHLSQPDESFYSDLPDHLPVYYTANAGMEFHSRHYNTPAYFSPNIMYAQQGFFKQVTGGIIAGINVFYGGLYYRHVLGSNNLSTSDSIHSGHASAFILLAGLQRGIFKVGYSYDININGFSGTGGSHEISVTFNFGDSQKSQLRNERRKLSNCPKLF